MTDTPSSGTFKIDAVYNGPLPGDLPPLRDDRNRWFVGDEITIIYRQEVAHPGTVDEQIGPWEISVATSGLLISAGAAGRRRTTRLYRDDNPADPIPGYLHDYVDRYHPAKRS